MSPIRLNAALLCLAFSVSNPALAADPDLMGGSSFSGGVSGVFKCAVMITTSLMPGNGTLPVAR